MGGYHFILASIFVAFLVTLSNASILDIREDGKDGVEGLASLETSDETVTLSEEQIPDLTKRQMDDSCWLNGRFISHGQTAQVGNINPCWTKQCWYGRLHDAGDGCNYEGSCRSINRDFDFKCARMRCSKRTTGNNSWQYQVSVVSQSCQDANGRCRSVGESGFPAFIRNQYYNNCSCRGSNGQMYCSYNY